MDRLKTLALPAAVLLAALSVASAVALGHRYETRQVANVLWVTDRLTGKVTYCAYAIAPGSGASCSDLAPFSWEAARQK